MHAGFPPCDQAIGALLTDLQVTILCTLGFDHENLTYRYASRDFRLTDVEGSVVRDLLA